MIAIHVDGQRVTASKGSSIIEAMWESGLTRVQGVGCLGQGVCGSCRAMVGRADSAEVEMLLACETVIEAGMQVSFITSFEPLRSHPYRLTDFQDSWQASNQLREKFPEAEHCRRCGGCDASCPKGIQVQRAVELAASGQMVPSGDLFETCIMCDLCSDACPEFIAPNHLGLAQRRVATVLFCRPPNLMARLQQIEQGELTVSHAL